MNVMLSGGGTGGHIYPALAVAEAIRQKYPDSRLVYVGNVDGMEHELAKEAGYEFIPVSVAGFKGRGPLQMLQMLYKNWRGLAEAKALLRQFHPDLVIGTGGYACGPLLLEATRLHIPTLLHEQNAIMGKTNKILSRHVNKICLTFPIANLPDAVSAKCELTGLPVRRAILETDTAAARQHLGLAVDKPVLVVTGGSQGARHINQAMAELWPELLAAGVQIVHITGEKLFDETAQLARRNGLPVDPKTQQAKDGFLLLPYLHHMEYALAAADLVISRAGASFLAEVMALGRAAILVPYPYAAGNHQVYNAQALVEAGAALLIEDAALSAQSLRQALQKALFDINLREKMAANSAALGKREAATAIIGVAAAVARL
ncbi:MAG: undecaprenyldiphospho-muramoylpentapeptide beta-N-acetylglucosaminyltransferase [Peptococcaceae bacterium]|jgi:UDP-N-acetylglucosamine--N-acetylmuramyl-(pentapeptide) pyrophosphoryl-undecaprenol N-acetylglucosamine transferase|nr:undecaprenyldiphospho-muramoylpentapeptide beta-N-acetylglucosaminyltransferase [Peptococcaceae bacterium]